MTRLLQALLVAAGTAVAAVMVLLGLWQMGVYQRQGDRATAELATLPAVPLTQVAAPSTQLTGGVGRTVTFAGRDRSDDQVLIPVDGRPGQYRVVTALVRTDGVIVPVVRGVISGDVAPPPPGRLVDQAGVLAPSEPIESAEAPAADPLPAGQLAGVQLAVLVQQWSGRMIAGYVTLTPADSHAQGLEPTSPALPRSQGRLRNGAYALQWWVFAAFGLGMSVKIAYDLGRRRELDEFGGSDDGSDDRSAGSRTLTGP